MKAIGSIFRSVMRPPVIRLLVLLGWLTIVMAFRFGEDIGSGWARYTLRAVVSSYLLYLLWCASVAIRREYRAEVRARRLVRNGCPRCGYDLVGLPSGSTCPECGASPPPAPQV